MRGVDAVFGLAPDLAAPTAHLFGPVALLAADSLALNLGKTGTTDLHVLSSVVLGPDSLDFALVTSGPFDIAPNTTGSLVVVFSPLALGTRHATLRIVSDDPDESPCCL